MASLTSWAGTGAGQAGGLGVPLIPSLGYAVYLISAVKCRGCGVLHLFEEEEFMRGLREYYANPSVSMAAPDLWYIQFSLLLALETEFVEAKSEADRNPTGVDLFMTALRLLLDVNGVRPRPTYHHAYTTPRSIPR